MVDRNIVNKLGLSEEKLDEQVQQLFSEEDSEFLEKILKSKVDSRLPGTILKGTIVSQLGDEVYVDVGLKSEGLLDVNEFNEDEEITPGNEVEVLLEDLDSGDGLIVLSKRKADRIRGWENIINNKKEGDVVTGKVVRRIKGGLLVDIGAPVFLPASQVDIRRPGDISRFIGQEVDCKILKIDIEGRNIVLSRRKLIEEQRKSSREQIMSEIEVGQWRKGVVKNISDFGVFVDLGGIDGLLHISDLSWGRISHPSEVVKLDQEIECVVIGVDKENEKISLGLKQKTPSPWEDAEQRYPVGSKVNGAVVNLTNYGAFVRLEEGIEGLVHISEMSWTKRLSHPGEIVNVGDEIEVVVLNVNKDKREISLGLKQTEINPWTLASKKYPEGTIINAPARSMTNFGAFVEIEPGIDGMIHISDLSWTKKYNHPSEMLEKDQKVKCVVLEVDEQRQRISLGIKQLNEDPWIRAIPEKYIPGQIIKGKITKITNFGAFVELEPELEGLLHISELADHKIDKPQDIVKVGQEVEVKILRIDPESRKIGLSLRRARWAAEEQEAEAQATATAKEKEKKASKSPESSPEDQKKTETESKDETKQPEDQQKSEDVKKQAEDEQMPEDETTQIENGQKLEDKIKQPEEEQKPEDQAKQPEDQTKQPEDQTKQPEDQTKQPEDQTKQADEEQKAEDKTKQTDEQQPAEPAQGPAENEQAEEQKKTEFQPPQAGEPQPEKQTPDQQDQENTSDENTDNS